MIEQSKRIKCDICGKVTEWEIIPDEPLIPESMKHWKQFDLGSSWHGDFKPKDYCSKECVIKDINDIYTNQSI